MDNPPPPNIKIRVPQIAPSTNPPPPIPPTPPNVPQSVYSNEPLPEEMYLRWRGRVVGPHPVAEIEQQLATQKIGMLHEVEVNGNWISLREYFSRRDARQRADAAAQADATRFRNEQLQAAKVAQAEAAGLRDEQLRTATVAEEKRRNDLLEAKQKKQTASAERGGMTGIQIIGLLLFIAGLALGGYFFNFFDQSVATESGNRVVNFGRMNDRQVGIVAGLGLVVVGTLMLLLGNRRPGNTSIQ